MPLCRRSAVSHLLEILQGPGAATANEGPGIEVTPAGKIFGLIVLLALIGDCLGHRNVGMVGTAVMLAVLAMWYWLKVHQSRHEAHSH